MNAALFNFFQTLPNCPMPQWNRIIYANVTNLSDPLLLFVLLLPGLAGHVAGEGLEALGMVTFRDS